MAAAALARAVEIGVLRTVCIVDQAGHPMVREGINPPNCAGARADAPARACSPGSARY
jgi:hypothetical protein